MKARMLALILSATGCQVTSRVGVERKDNRPARATGEFEFHNPKRPHVRPVVTVAGGPKSKVSYTASLEFTSSF